MPDRRYPVQVRDIRVADLPHEHETCDATGDPYLCPIPDCWWNHQGEERPIPEEWTVPGSDLPYCPLCGNVNRADLGPVTGMCLDGRACRRRQAGVEPVNPDGGTDD